MCGDVRFMNCILVEYRIYAFVISPIPISKQQKEFSESSNPYIFYRIFRRTKIRHVRILFGDKNPQRRSRLVCVSETEDWQSWNVQSFRLWWAAASNGDILTLWDILPAIQP